MNASKLAVINLVGWKLCDDGVTNDERFLMNAYGISPFTQIGFADLGIPGGSTTAP